MINLTLCARCGYKMLSPGSDDPEEIRAAKKVAQRARFHFEAKPLEECPREDCLRRLANDRVEVADEDVHRAIAAIDRASTVIVEIRKAIEGTKTMLDGFPTIDIFIKSFETLKTSGIDTGPTFIEFQSAVEEYRDTVNEFAVDLAKLNERLRK